MRTPQTREVRSEAPSASLRPARPVARTCRFVGLNMSLGVLGNYHTGLTPIPSNANPDNAETQVEHVAVSLKTQDQESARRADPNADQGEHADRAETQL